MSEIKLGLGLYRHMLTDDYFAFAKQCGCTHLIIHLADYYSKQIVTATNDSTNYGLAKGGEDIWSAEHMTDLQKMAGRYGLCIYGIENFSPADWYDILLDGPGRQEQMEVLKQIIRNAGKAGRRSFGYNFSLAGVWGHQKHPHARGGAMSTCFDSSEIKYDAPIPKGQIWNMTYAEGDSAYLEPVSSLQLWDRLKRFLEKILPVAVIDISPSKSNKLELCLGSIQEMTHGSVYDAIEQYGGQGRISYVHFRNVKGKVPKYDEVFVDEGDIDMLRALALLEAHNFDGVIIPDHTPEILCSAPWHAGMAFALGYMRSALQMASKGLLKEILDQGEGSYEG